MAIYVFVLAVSLMFSGAQGISHSMSCSTVNGKMICDKQTSQGGTAAMSSSQSFAGPGSSYQNTFAGAGVPGAFQTSGQTVQGGYSGGYASQGGYFPPNGAFYPAVGGFGFTSAGGFPYQYVNPYVPGFAYPPQYPAAPAAGNAPPFNPFGFVNGFMGGAPGAGAFAGAGAFPFGRR